MAVIDDEVLAYAMTMGLGYKLWEPLPGKAKKVKYRELWLDVKVLAAGGYEDRPGPVAHFIARLMSDRSVTVKKAPHYETKFHWVIADGRTGLELRFESQSERSVRALMAEVSSLEVDAELGVMEAAIEKLRLFRRLEAIAITKERTAEKKWPPPDGSQPARILALARASTSFRYTRLVNQSYGWSYVKATKAAAFVAKLKNPALAVASFTVYEHDSPAGIEERIPPGYVYVVVAFCAINDPRGEEVSKYEFIAKSEEPAVTKKPSPRKTKPVG